MIRDIVLGLLFMAFFIFCLSMGNHLDSMEFTQEQVCEEQFACDNK